jgi:hypothetical protein
MVVIDKRAENAILLVELVAIGVGARSSLHIDQFGCVGLQPAGEQPGLLEPEEIKGWGFPGVWGGLWVTF